MRPAAALHRAGEELVVTLSDEAEVAGRAIVVATGASYRRLGVPELEALNGAGVFYGAATTEARAWKAGGPTWWVVRTRLGRRRCTCLGILRG